MLFNQAAVSVNIGRVCDRQCSIPSVAAVSGLYSSRNQPMCRPKSEPAEAPKGNALRAEKAAEAEGNEQGLDELMLLAQSRHLSEEPEAPDGSQGAQAHRPRPVSGQSR